MSNTKNSTQSKRLQSLCTQSNLDESFNILKSDKYSSLCECCLSTDDLRTVLEPLEVEENTVVFSEMLYYCFSIEINHKQYTSSHFICNRCIDKLRNTYLFRNQVEYSQEKIKNYFHKNDSTQSKTSFKSYEDLNRYIQDDVKDGSTSDDATHGMLDVEFIKKETKEDNNMPSKKLFTKCIKKVSAKKPRNHRKICRKIVTHFHNENKILDTQLANDNFHQTALTEEGLLNMKPKKYSDLCVESKEHILSQARKKYAESIPYKLEKDALVCPICNETFVTNKYLVIHMSIHYPNFICDTCGKSFVCKRRLSGHKRNTHTSQIPCTICKKMLKKSNMSQHLRIHAGTSQLCKQCLYCDEKFPSFTLRARHMSSVHGIDPYKYQCKLCPKNFITAGALSTHVRKCHLLSINYNCSDCGKGFFDKRDLDDHALTHSGVKNFQCELCQKSFARRATLIQHIKIHTNDKKYHCDICDRSFTQKCTLKGHMKIHIKDNVVSKSGKS